MKNITETTNDLIKPLRIGEIVTGKVIGNGQATVYLDLSPWGTGIIYGKEFYDAKNILKDLKVGDTISAKIVDFENEQGYIELSLSGASRELAWENLKQKKDSGEVISVKVIGANKGGLLTEIAGIPAFLPVSQLSPTNYPRVEGGDSTRILKELQKFTGKEMRVKIFDVSAKEEKIILSERAIESDKIKEILTNYKVGDVVEAEITGIVDFGVFVKFGKEDLEGLIHISELDWQLIEDPAKIVKVGEKVEAKIIEINDERVSLSMKALKKDPWAGIDETYKKGDEVKGKVTKFNPFGAFVQITPKIQGLCHISEFGSQKKMEETIKIGEEYDFKILSVEPAEHKMTLKPQSQSEN